MSRTKKGFELLRDKSLNQSIAFSRKDRERRGLRGLLPHRLASQKELVARVMTNLERLPRDIDRYMLLSGLQRRNERIFYRTVIDHIQTVMPLIYTPRSARRARSSRTSPASPRASSSRPKTAGRSGASSATGPSRTSG